MKKFVIVLICVLVSVALFASCTDKKDNKQQDQDIGNSVEIDISDGEDNIDEPAGSVHLPDGFTYSFKDPDNADNIVVTPKE